MLLPLKQQRKGTRQAQTTQFLMLVYLYNRNNVDHVDTLNLKKRISFISRVENLSFIKAITFMLLYIYTSILIFEFHILLGLLLSPKNVCIRDHNDFSCRNELKRIFLEAFSVCEKALLSKRTQKKIERKRK